MIGDTVYDRQQDVLEMLAKGELDKLTDDEVIEWEEAEHSALLAWPTDGGRRSWEALNAEIAKRGLSL